MVNTFSRNDTGHHQAVCFSLRLTQRYLISAMVTCNLYTTVHSNSSWSRTSTAWSRSESRFGASRNSASASTFPPCMRAQPHLGINNTRIPCTHSHLNLRTTATHCTFLPCSNALVDTLDGDAGGLDLQAIPVK